ncbi:B3GNTL1 protein [Capsaspora owczarzaki ATCC 30864]|uniref:B3GNTL1 protein n=1 Tax=Capsaspora owczarzaki (strain ATCC 30864) TaxID=595528 RepID=A0A0D2WTG9_CAPO3|nr:B3GNTL1 protein [Capsaspora owczarzaki ATCC 30864]KJE95770.1 B3GNTL1 protein [Capsaspora owczarzaki ATCC 30864]|eukprot:XP_004345774.2 B3GNTL1 protein [Capsaspora owczarzaki ATCC 30864]
MTLISVIIPMYNASRFLQATIESIVAQTYRPLEICVFNDGSTDDSCDLLRALAQRLGIAVVQDDSGRAYLKEEVERLFVVSRDQSLPETPFSAAMLELAEFHKVTPQDISPSLLTNRSVLAINEQSHGADGTCAPLTLRLVTRGEQDCAVRGPGNGRNRAVRESTGEFLCFIDADDVMMADRVAKQLELALKEPRALVGSNFTRDPPDSTARYARWCNSLTDEQLTTHRFKECTIIQPTWFMSRRNFDIVGGYDINGWAEDLKFLYRHVALGGTLHKVQEPLLMYRYVQQSVSSIVPRTLVRDIRLRAFESQILSSPNLETSRRWSRFTIWGAGRDGKQFLKGLSKDYQRQVIGFCDVDPAKIGRNVSVCGETRRDVLFNLPCVHFSEAKPPLLICVTMDRPLGEGEVRQGPSFEENLSSLNLREGVDYFLFG